MKQNRSHAVMAQRVEPPDSLDYFPTPPWATRALLEHAMADLWFPHHVVWEPACGEGHMARPLGEYFAEVRASDIFDYGFGRAPVDFLAGRADLLGPAAPADPPIHWVITNPPFNAAQGFVERALTFVQVGVALLVRLSFLESLERYRSIFSPHPPWVVAQFVERVPMFKGRLDPKGSTATAYAWVIWLAGEAAPEDTRFRWIPPCRARLEKPGDYR